MPLGNGMMMDDPPVLGCSLLQQLVLPLIAILIAIDAIDDKRPIDRPPVALIALYCY